MNLNPAADELTNLVKSLQDFINDTFDELKSKDYPTNPKDFTISMQSIFCDFLDSAQAVESVLEKAVERVSAKYEECYNKEFGLAKVYNISDYKKSRKPPELDAVALLLEEAKSKHPSSKWNDK
jgi:hypothetical protein